MSESSGSGEDRRSDRLYSCKISF